MFSQVSVCPRGGGDCLWSQADNPAGRHPISACWDTYPLSSACWDAHPPPVQCMLGYGQQAGDMHPIGMHSC